MCEPVTMTILATAAVASAGYGIYSGERQNAAQREAMSKNMKYQKAQAAKAELDAKTAPRQVDASNDIELRQRQIAAMRTGLMQTVKTSAAGLTTPAPVAQAGLTGTKKLLGQ